MSCVPCYVVARPSLGPSQCSLSQPKLYAHTSAGLQEPAVCHQRIIPSKKQCYSGVLHACISIRQKNFNFADMHALQIAWGHFVVQMSGIFGSFQVWKCATVTCRGFFYKILFFWFRLSEKTNVGAYYHMLLSFWVFLTFLNFKLRTYLFNRHFT